MFYNSITFLPWIRSDEIKKINRKEGRRGENYAHSLNAGAGYYSYLEEFIYILENKYHEAAMAYQDGSMGAKFKDALGEYNLWKYIHFSNQSASE